MIRLIQPTPRHIEAMRLREEEHLTFRAIGERLGVSTEWARQIVGQILQRRRLELWVDAAPADGGD